MRVDRALLGFLLIAYPALFVQEVLLDPFASRLFGWSLASTTALGGLWALGAVAGLLLLAACVAGSGPSVEVWPRWRPTSCWGWGA